MKKISNWVFGSMFRTLGRLLAFSLVGFLFVYLISYKNADLKSILYKTLFGINYVYADTIGYDWSDWGVENYECSVQGTNCYVTTTPTLKTYNSKFYTDGSHNVGFFWYRVATGSQTFMKDYSYTLRFTIVTTGLRGKSDVISNLSNINSHLLNYSFYVNTNSSTSGAYLADFPYGMRFENTNTNNTFYLYITFSPTQNIKFVDFKFSLLDANNTYNSTDLIQFNGFYDYTTTALQITYDSGSIGAINNQTNIINNKLNETNNHISSGFHDLQDSLTDSNIDSSKTNYGNFFSQFNTNTYGLTSIITAPLNAIQNLTSSSCSSLVLPLPYVNENLTLPCMRSLYISYFGDFMTIYDTITIGIVSYWVLIRLFKFLKDFKDPNNDEIEVVDL